MKTESISAKMTVTLVLGDKTIELSEADARKVLAELKRLFRDEPNLALWSKQTNIPQWPGPTLTMPVKTDDIPYYPKIICSTSRISE